MNDVVMYEQLPSLGVDLNRLYAKATFHYGNCVPTFDSLYEAYIELLEAKLEEELFMHRKDVERAITDVQRQTWPDEASPLADTSTNRRILLYEHLNAAQLVFAMNGYISNVAVKGVW